MLIYANSTVVELEVEVEIVLCGLLTDHVIVEIMKRLSAQILTLLVK